VASFQSRPCRTPCAAVTYARAIPAHQDMVIVGIRRNRWIRCTATACSTRRAHAIDRRVLTCQCTARGSRATGRAYAEPERGVGCELCARGAQSRGEAYIGTVLTQRAHGPVQLASYLPAEVTQRCRNGGGGALTSTHFLRRGPRTGGQVSGLRSRAARSCPVRALLRKVLKPDFTPPMSGLSSGDRSSNRTLSCPV